MEAQQERVESIPNLLKVFSRNGKMLYIQDIRAAVYPLHVIIINGILTGVIIILLPPVLYFILEISFVIFASYRGLNNSFEIVLSYLGYIYQLLLLMAVLGGPAALLRRFCISHDLSFSRQVDADTEFRIGGEELALTFLFTIGLFLISETARYFNVFTFFGSLFITYFWLYVNNILLSWYGRISHNNNPQKLYLIWNFIQDQGIILNSALDQIGLKNGGRTLLVRGDISTSQAHKLQEKILENMSSLEEVEVQTGARKQIKS